MLIWLPLLIIFLLITALLLQYRISIAAAYERLAQYPVQTMETAWGMLSYIDEGEGPAVLLSHGIFGGYDQASVSLENLFGDQFRKIAPSRFGYPGSTLPAAATPQNQAAAFVELLDELNIEKTYVIATSAGGASALRMALDAPERVAGLILLSSGVPGAQKSADELPHWLGPPQAMTKNFPMWLTVTYFRPVLKTMFGSEIPANMADTLLPTNPRQDGIKADATITNLDMDLRYDEYPVEEIQAPILVVHAEDDPMAKYEATAAFIARTHAQTAIFTTGGHLISGHDNAVGDAISEFITKTETP